jgi:hypothetical protein
MSITSIGALMAAALANSYLTGQSFAFEISAVLLVVALVSVVSAKLGEQPIISAEAASQNSDRPESNPK